MDDDPDLNYVVSPIEVKINIEDQQGVKLCLKAKKQIYKEFEKLDILISNA